MPDTTKTPLRAEWVCLTPYKVCTQWIHSSTSKVVSRGTLLLFIKNVVNMCQGGVLFHCFMFHVKNYPTVFSVKTMTSFVQKQRMFSPIPTCRPISTTFINCHFIISTFNLQIIPWIGEIKSIKETWTNKRKAICFYPYTKVESTGWLSLFPSPVKIKSQA